MPESEAEIWIGWGTHVFREGDGKTKGAALETYSRPLAYESLTVRFSPPG
jgi:hypothetical protein